MSRSMKKGVCVLTILLFLFTLVLPVFAMEIETGQEPANDAAQVFIEAVNALDRDAIINASNAWGLASQAWQADPENEELAAALDEVIAAQDAATQPLYAAEDLYYELSEEEQQREDVQTAYNALCSLYTAMCSAMDNPVAPGTGTDDPPPEDSLSVLYGDLPDAPTGSYMGSAGLPIATGETKISISGWTEDLSASGYLNAEALNSDSLTLTVGREEGEEFAIVPILTQVEYPANNSVSYITLPEDVTLLGYDFTPAEDSAKLLEQTYMETSAAVSGIYVQASHDFTALFTYVAGDGTRLEKVLNVEVRADADPIPTLYSTISAATYSRPTPSVTSGKITSVQKISGTWLIWFNGEDAYCCDNGKNGRPAGCPTYHYTLTSTVDATQYVPGDHYFDASINRIAAWTVGFRSVQKALLQALLTPNAAFMAMQDEGRFTELLVAQEESKTLPFGEIWAEYCRRAGVPEDGQWLAQVQAYERDVLSKRV